MRASRRITWHDASRDMVQMSALSTLKDFRQIGIDMERELALLERKLIAAPLTQAVPILEASYDRAYYEDTPHATFHVYLGRIPIATCRNKEDAELIVRALNRP